MSHWTPDQLPDLSAQTILITGANSGIGLEAARVLAQKGARVVLACRSAEKARGAVESCVRDRSDARVEAMSLDLASLASVRAFAEECAKRFPEGIDVLVNNAGVMALPRKLTADGFEMQLGTNHLGHFALTGLMLPQLAKRPHARVVNVSSGMHWVGKIRFDDLMGERRYDRWAAYAQSKLANLLFTHELQKRLAAKYPSVIAVAAHPGYSATNLQTVAAEGRGPLAAWSARWGNALFAQSAASGALPTVRAAADPNVKGGDYYGPAWMSAWGPAAHSSQSARSRDDSDSRRLWEESSRLTGVDYAGM
jgi:NAD(P)-dependent dehydrogenase (short-subunit alcohol dehydrogenase family)